MCNAPSEGGQLFFTVSQNGNMTEDFEIEANQ